MEKESTRSQLANLPGGWFVPLSQALQRARGRNLYRGTNLYLPDQQRVILQPEARGQLAQDPPLVIRYHQHGYACRLPNAELTCPLGGDLDAFLEPLLAYLRGGKAHVRTYLHRTEYK